MSKKKSLSSEIIEGLEEYKLYKDGKSSDTLVYTFPKVPDSVDVKLIRSKLGMTQEQFTAFGFSLSAIRHWEAKRRTPEGAARVLLKVIEQNPHFVLEALNTSSHLIQ